MITINDLNKSENFFLMAGPCVIEGEDMALRIAEKIVGITKDCIYPMYSKAPIGKRIAPVWILLRASGMRRR